MPLICNKIAYRSVYFFVCGWSSSSHVCRYDAFKPESVFWLEIWSILLGFFIQISNNFQKNGKHFEFSMDFFFIILNF